MFAKILRNQFASSYKSKCITTKGVFPLTTQRSQLIKWKSMLHVPIKCMIKHIFHLHKNIYFSLLAFQQSLGQYRALKTMLACSYLYHPNGQIQFITAIKPCQSNNLDCSNGELSTCLACK